MPGVKGMKGGGGLRTPGPGKKLGRPLKLTQCSVCIHWTVDPLCWWGMCSQLMIQTEADFCCQRFFRIHAGGLATSPRKAETLTLTRS